MKADLILHNARIYTLEPAQPWAEAVACANGKILAVGREADILALAQPKTQLIDASKRLILPGLIDAHIHFLQHAIRQHQVSLAGLRRFDEVRQRAGTVAARLGLGRKFVGRAAGRRTAG